MAHTLIAIDTDPIQHEKLLDSINNRKYGLAKFRAGYNIPQVSEVRFYNIRCKKEEIPFFLRDLQARNMLSKSDIKHTLSQSKADYKTKLSLKIRITMWIMEKILKTAGINKAPAYADGPAIPFVEGWCYAYCFGTLKDHETEWGEWL